MRLRFWKGGINPHAYPLALNRRLVASLQLYSLVVFVWPLGVGRWGPLSRDSPVHSLVPSIYLQALVGEPPPSMVRERVVRTVGQPQPLTG
jgi:hypothetical protein